MNETTHEVELSSIISESGPLRLKTQADGTFRLQGVFRMRDQEGFPIDMSYEIAQDNGWDIDWIEALADASRQSLDKYDGLIEEIGMLEPERLPNIRKLFSYFLMSSEGETLDEKAANLYKRFHQAR